MIRVWNRTAEAVFGHSASEAVGASLDLIIPERFRDAHWTGFRRAIAVGQTKYSGRALTTRSVHKDGRKLYVELSFELVANDAGQVIGVLALGRDCTAAKLAGKAA